MRRSPSVRPCGGSSCACTVPRQVSSVAVPESSSSVVFDDGPRVELPGRNYALFVGPLAGLQSLMDAQDEHSPNLWWPDDRAWCVATEIDLAWTYVGGSAALISDVLASPRLEAQPASTADNYEQRAPQWLAAAIEGAVTPMCRTSNGLECSCAVPAPRRAHPRKPGAGSRPAAPGPATAPLHWARARASRCRGNRCTNSTPLHEATSTHRPGR